MNNNSRLKLRLIALVVAALLAVGMGLFPPLNYVVIIGKTLPDSYGWFLQKPPTRLSEWRRVDHDRLFWQYVALVGATGVSIFLTRKKAQHQGVGDGSGIEEKPSKLD